MFKFDLQLFAVDDQYTIALMHFDDPLLHDQSGMLWFKDASITGDPISTAQKKIGQSSLHLTGNQFIYSPYSDDFRINNDDFTIEAYIYLTNVSMEIFDAGGAWSVGISGGTKLRFSSQGNPTIDFPYNFALGTWYHVGIARFDDLLYGFVNGISIIPDGVTFSHNIDYPLDIAKIGPLYGGYIDEFRISKGIARWTENFRPPTAQYGISDILVVNNADAKRVVYLNVISNNVLIDTKRNLYSNQILSIDTNRVITDITISTPVVINIDTYRSVVNVPLIIANIANRATITTNALTVLTDWVSGIFHPAYLTDGDFTLIAGKANTSAVLYARFSEEYDITNVMFYGSPSYPIDYIEYNGVAYGERIAHSDSSQPITIPVNSSVSELEFIFRYGGLESQGVTEIEIYATIEDPNIPLSINVDTSRVVITGDDPMPVIFSSDTKRTIVEVVASGTIFNADTTRIIVNRVLITDITENFDNTYLIPFDGDWIKSTTTPNSGTYCYTNKDIDDNGSSTTSLTVDIASGGSNVSFYYRASSEDGLDKGFFYIDGVVQLTVSGEVAWTQASYVLAEGTHVLKWEYTKDSADIVGEDSVYIDDLIITNTVGSFVCVTSDTSRNAVCTQTINSDTVREVCNRVIINTDTNRKFKTNIFGAVKVETINIVMQINNAFDTVSAVVYSAENYAETMNFFGKYQGLDIDFITERVKENHTLNGKKWTLSGRSDTSTLLLKPVVKLTGGGTASDICHSMGLTTDFTDFTPAFSKLGWRNSTTKAISITEKSVSAVLSKMFSWTKGLGTREIVWYQRGTVIHVCERGKINNTYALEDYKYENLEIDSQIILRTSESLCITGTGTESTVSTPGSYCWTPEYATVPITETQTFGNSSIVIVDGLTMSETNGDNSTVYTYNQIYSSPYSSSFNKPLYSVISSKVVTNATSRSTTTYTYGTPTSKTNEVTLAEETTVVESYTESGSWVVDNTHRTVHTPLSNGFYGHTVYEKTTDSSGNITNTVVSTSLSRGAPGGQASLATVQEISGYKSSGSTDSDTDTVITEKFNGVVISSTSIPVQEYSIINQYVRIVNAMNKAKEIRLSAKLIGGTLIDARQSTITFEGNLYYLESVSITGSATVLRQQNISAVRWA